MKTYKIHFISNGITQGNLEERYLGRTDEELCEKGIEQLKRIAGEMEYPYCEIVISSPLKRCVQTAKLLYPDKEPVIIPDLTEYNFGEFDGLTASDLKDNELFARWLSGDRDAVPPFGESNEEFTKRIAQCFDGIVTGLIKTGMTDSVIVTHGGVIMAILSLFAFPEKDMSYWRTMPGTGFSVSVTPQLWSQIKKCEVMGQIPVPHDLDDDDHLGVYSIEL